MITGVLRRQRPSRAARQEARTALLLLSPALLLLLLLRIIPAGLAIGQSFYTSVPGSVIPPRWVGWQNYLDLFDDPSFWASVAQTLLFAVLVNPLTMLCALFLAWLLTRNVALTGLWRTLAFLPTALPLMGTTVVFGVLLRPEGVVNSLLSRAYLPTSGWFTDVSGAMAALVILSTWTAVGYWMIFLIAAIRDVPRDYYDAAMLDGAGELQQFFSVTLPLIQRQLLFVLTASTVWNFILYAPIGALTKGGPQGSTNFLMYDIITRYYALSSPGSALAEMSVLFILMGATVWLQFRLLNRMRRAE
ncbi:carbohydrate ABC transporter permease [Sodalis praecaptivus]|uniref:carbohydrate ABC transporter permease n=1 Tax=Sodalis TaxID=84565 RepID=UPI00046CC023|nr:sugar ABC transporter permease [Sodalis praecaptivus]